MSGALASLMSRRGCERESLAKFGRYLPGKGSRELHRERKALRAQLHVVAEATTYKDSRIHTDSEATAHKTSHMVPIILGRPRFAE